MQRLEIPYEMTGVIVTTQTHDLLHRQERPFQETSRVTQANPLKKFSR